MSGIFPDFKICLCEIHIRIQKSVIFFFACVTNEFSEGIFVSFFFLSSSSLPSIPQKKFWQQPECQLKSSQDFFKSSETNE